MKTRKRNRLKGFDYSSERIYFLTSCVHGMICCLGSVKNGRMILNSYCEIVNEQILWLSEQYPYFQIHNHVVMPNHVHILAEIDTGIERTVRTGRDLSLQRDLSLRESTRKIKSIPELMGAFKTTSSKKIHSDGMPDFQWHRSFYDHIVRDELAYDRIFDYIDNNPAKWMEDKFNETKE